MSPVLFVFFITKQIRIKLVLCVFLVLFVFYNKKEFSNCKPTLFERFEHQERSFQKENIRGIAPGPLPSHLKMCGTTKGTYD